MKILVALDRSTQAATILDQALEMVKQFKAECILYTLAEDIPDFGEGIAVGLSEQIQLDAEKAMEAALAKAVTKGVQARKVLDTGGSPADGILDCAESEGIDLIIMGSRAKSGLDRFLIGSVATKVVSHAKCSVMVLR